VDVDSNAEVQCNVEDVELDDYAEVDSNAGVDYQCRIINIINAGGGEESP